MSRTRNDTTTSYARTKTVASYRVSSSNSILWASRLDLPLSSPSTTPWKTSDSFMPSSTLHTDGNRLPGSAGRRTRHAFTNLTHHGFKLFATPHTRAFRLQTCESSPKCLVRHHLHAKVVRYRQSRLGWRWRSRAGSRCRVSI